MFGVVLTHSILIGLAFLFTPFDKPGFLSVSPLERGAERSLRAAIIGGALGED